MSDSFARYSGCCLTPRIAHAAAWDAGNRSMRDGRRSVWNAGDYEAARETYERLAREYGFWVDEGTNDPDAYDRLIEFQSAERMRTANITS